MSFPDLSVQDLYRVISYEDLFIKERQYINADDWENLMEQHEEDEPIESGKSIISLEGESVAPELVENQSEEIGEEVSTSLGSVTASTEEKPQVLTSNYDKYKAECKKYCISPDSSMKHIHEQQELDLNVSSYKQKSRFSFIDLITPL